jgi:hypothetical protein
MTEECQIILKINLMPRDKFGLPATPWLEELEEALQARLKELEDVRKMKEAAPWN